MFAVHADHPISPTRTLQTKYGVVMMKNIGDLLISSGEDNKLRIWNMDHRTGDIQLTKTLKAHRGPIHKAVAFHSLLFTISSRDNTLKAWDLQSLDRPMEFPEVHTRPILDLDVDDSIKQPIIYTASMDATIKIWDFKNPFVRPAELLGHTDAVTCIKVRGNYVVSGSTDQTVRIWDKRRLACLSIITTHASPVVGIKALEKVIFSFDRSGVVVVTKIKSNEMKFKLDLGYPVLRLRVQKKFLMVVGTKALETYTVKGKKIASYEGHAGDITSAAFYDQDYIFSTSVDRTTVLWNVKRAQQMFTYRGHHSPVTDLAFYNQWIYTSAPDGTIRQWPNPVYDPQSDNNMEWIY